MTAAPALVIREDGRPTDGLRSLKGRKKSLMPDMHIIVPPHSAALLGHGLHVYGIRGLSNSKTSQKELLTKVVHHLLSEGRLTPIRIGKTPNNRILRSRKTRQRLAL